MKWQLLYQVFDRDQVELSAHLFSRPASNYDFQGGLSPTQAGISVRSAGDVRTTVRDCWQTDANNIPILELDTNA